MTREEEQINDAVGRVLYWHREWLRTRQPLEERRLDHAVVAFLRVLYRREAGTAIVRSLKH